MPISRSTACVIQFLAPYRNRILRLLGVTVCLSVLVVLPPLLIREVIDGVLTEGHTDRFSGLAALLLCVPVLVAVAGYIQTTGLAYLGQRFIFDVRNELYRHLLSLSMRFYHKHSVGMLVNRLMGDSTTIQQVLTAQTINVVSDMAVAVFVICATFAISWRLGIVMLLIIGVFVLNFRVNIVKIREATRGYRGAYDRLSGGIQNRLGGAVAVKTFGTELREHGQFQSTLGTSLDLVQEAEVTNNEFNMNTQLIHQVGHSILYFLGCALILQGRLSYGDVVAFTAYAVQLLMPAVRFSMIAKQFQDVAIAIERIMELFDEAPELKEAAEPIDIDRLSGDVEFDRVEFQYVRNQPVIRDFSLKVEPGMTVALIGPTGCGKTTLLSLILRYYDVRGGELRLDGRDIRQYSLKTLRRQFGIVLQEPLLFSVSIAENIRYGKPGATRADIEAAARVAEIHEFVAGLPDGYDTLVGSEGLDLSVGQRQRITIARAVLADPSILIMDEATSSLDSDSERAIQKAMTRVLKGRTCFIVAHRLSTIRNADRIVLLKDGLILEQGNHKELMAIPDGRYKHLYETHMGRGSIEEED